MPYLAQTVEAESSDFVSNLLFTNPVLDEVLTSPYTRDYHGAWRSSEARLHGV